MKKWLSLGFAIGVLATGYFLSHQPSLGNKGPEDKPIIDFWEPMIPDLTVSYNGMVIENAEREMHSSKHHQGSAAYTMSPDAKVRVTFQGTQIEWIGLAYSYSGMARIKLDGIERTIIDMYQTKSQYQNTLYTSPPLPYGEHTLEIEAMGKKNERALGYQIVIDGFRVTSGQGESIWLDEADPRIEYINANRYAYLHFWNRKLAHITEFFIITIAMLSLFHVWRLRWKWAVPLLSLGWAVTDEFHQSFIAGRSSSWFDVGIDAIGVGIAVLFYFIVLAIKNSVQRQRQRLKHKHNS